MTQNSYIYRCEISEAPKGQQKYGARIQPTIIAADFEEALRTLRERHQGCTVHEIKFSGAVHILAESCFNNK